MDLLAVRPAKYIGEYWLPDDIVNRRLIQDDRWQLTQSFRIGLPDGRVIKVPAGFIYDKASIPRIVWWYIPRDDKSIERAALAHDFLYGEQEIAGEPVTRKEPDGIFYDIMKLDNMRFDKRHLAYRAVRLGGGSAWKNNK